MPVTRPAAWCCALLLGLVSSACAAERDEPLRWKLPKKLNEISGLALSADGRLFAHDDERAVIYEVDFNSGRLVKAFALGDPTLRGDFEGIAFVAEDLYLVTSGGEFVVAREGQDGERVAYRRLPALNAGQCEVEGLAFDPQTRLLWLACKQMPEGVAELKLFAWSPQRQARAPEHDIVVPVAALAGQLQLRHFNPSGVAVREGACPLLLLAARQRAVAGITRAGELCFTARLPGGGRHPQPEGIAITPDGRVLIADEAGKGSARLTVYPANRSFE